MSLMLLLFLLIAKSSSNTSTAARVRVFSLFSLSLSHFFSCSLILPSKTAQTSQLLTDNCQLRAKKNEFKLINLIIFK